VEELKSKYNKQYNHYYRTISLQQRYKIVIELCRINRLQNEETMSVISYILGIELPPLQLQQYDRPPHFADAQVQG
jgi:hypothetical protein